jgi:hypothetical protein
MLRPGAGSAAETRLDPAHYESNRGVTQPVTPTGSVRLQAMISLAAANRGTLEGRVTPSRRAGGVPEARGSPQAAAPLPQSRGGHAVEDAVGQPSRCPAPLPTHAPHATIWLGLPQGGGGTKVFVGRACRATRPKNLTVGVTQPVTPTDGPTGLVRLQTTESLAAADRGTPIFPTEATALAGQAAWAHMQGSEPPQCVGVATL